VAGRRRFVAAARPRVSARRASQLVGLSRRWLSYLSRRKEDGVVERLKELAARFPRFGYRRLHAMLKREGRKINLKRVRRLCRVQGLKLSRKVRRKRRGIGIGVPCKAEYPNHVWAYDFLFDQCENGRKLKVLTIEDEFTRRCLAIEVEYRMNSAYVGATLLRLFAEYGAPTYVRSDNGPEFIAKLLMRMLKIQGVECRHIEPGSPWQNGLDERFNGSYRDECGNLETFYNRDHARALSQLYKRHYNQERPHSSLAYQTPLEFAARCGIRPALSEVEKKEEKEVADLSLCASSGCAEKGSGPTPRVNRPANRRMVHVGAPVASQQSRILRVDGKSVPNGRRAEKVSAASEVT
jgi:transposase InsO family protein